MLHHADGAEFKATVAESFFSLIKTELLDRQPRRTRQSSSTSRAGTSVASGSHQCPEFQARLRRTGMPRSGFGEEAVDLRVGDLLQGVRVPAGVAVLVDHLGADALGEVRFAQERAGDAELLCQHGFQ